MYQINLLWQVLISAILTLSLVAMVLSLLCFKKYLSESMKEVTKIDV